MENREGTRLKGTGIRYSSGVFGEQIASIQSSSVRSRRNHLNVSNLARKIEESLGAFSVAACFLVKYHGGRDLSLSLLSISRM